MKVVKLANKILTNANNANPVSHFLQISSVNVNRVSTWFQTQTYARNVMKKIVKNVLVLGYAKYVTLTIKSINFLHVKSVMSRDVQAAKKLINVKNALIVRSLMYCLMNALAQNPLISSIQTISVLNAEFLVVRSVKQVLKLNVAVVMHARII